MKSETKTRGTNFSFYLTEEQVRMLQEAHWRERKSVSEIVREAIDDWLKSHAEGNTTFKLTKWQENPEFMAIPTLLSPNERWSKYIDSCNDHECTRIGTMSNYVHNLVKMRRTKESKERMKNKWLVR
jgi:Arc/MetJ-type ribon-helix-helix transcriptional regulator